MKSMFVRVTLALALLVPVVAWSQVSVSIGIAPPPLPVYAQPPVPGDGFIWTPGYWAWSQPDNDYYWVRLAPGCWRPTWAICGPRVTGHSRAVATSGIPATGVAKSASTAA